MKYKKRIKIKRLHSPNPSAAPFLGWCCQWSFWWWWMTTYSVLAYPVLGGHRLCWWVGSWCRGLQLFSLGSVALGSSLGVHFKRWWSVIRSLVLGLGLLWLCTNLGSARDSGHGSLGVWDLGLWDRLVWVGEECSKDGSVSDDGEALALLHLVGSSWCLALSDPVDGDYGLVVGGCAYWWRVRPHDTFTEVGLFWAVCYGLRIGVWWAWLCFYFCTEFVIPPLHRVDSKFNKLGLELSVYCFWVLIRCVMLLCYLSYNVIKDDCI